ncbi:hypothetical protein AVEN_254005-1 [Araneus ventricosus]|uniref:Uncharacterized protein n=1 Tax=Araneus ventricosus TaxID=182803 RepID=A0A4Y2E8Z4_ARAVE|nr:hypothetical protein AVEN_254005-1 [Araneus ventricosus]
MEIGCLESRSVLFVFLYLDAILRIGFLGFGVYGQGRSLAQVFTEESGCPPKVTTPLHPSRTSRRPLGPFYPNTRTRGAKMNKTIPSQSTDRSGLLASSRITCKATACQGDLEIDEFSL